MHTNLGKYDPYASEEPARMARLYLAEDETGWVEVVGPGLVRIANIPYDGIYNIDDVVRLDAEAMLDNPNQVLKGTIEERVYPVRTILMYPKVSDFKKIGALVKKLGGKMEGAIGPRRGVPGFLSLAAKSEADVLKIVRDLELPQETEKGWKPNLLRS
jgi:hypothetical protein